MKIAKKQETVSNHSLSLFQVYTTPNPSPLVPTNPNHPTN